MWKRCCWMIWLALVGCNTYSFSSDPYVVGLRWYDRHDYERAKGYWEPLAAKGDCDAEYRLGTLYFLGQAVLQDNEKAISLWRKAANGNQQRAQWALGDLYYGKREVIYHRCDNCQIESDVVHAYMWYRLFDKSAKYAGETEWARKMLANVKNAMSEAQVKEGDVLVAQWKPTPKDCNARRLS